MLAKLFSKQLTEPKLSLKQWLFLSCGFSCLLICVRIAVTGYHTYMFLVWNLFFAFIPYLASEWLFQNINVLKSRIKITGLLLLWLLFIPNSFYIITDLFHFDRFDSAPRWFDLLLLFSFAWNGLLLGILSVIKIEFVIRFISKRKATLIFVFAVMWLNAFGIYIGRYLRYNSWDIIMQPFSLFNEMLQIIVHPFQNKMGWGMIMVWTVFMTLLYMTIKMIRESFTADHQHEP